MALSASPVTSQRLFINTRDCIIFFTVGCASIVMSVRLKALNCSKETIKQLFESMPAISSYPLSNAVR